MDTKQAFLSLNVLELAITECPAAVAVGGQAALTISAFNLAAPKVPVYLQQAGAGKVAVADDAGGVPGAVVLAGTAALSEDLYERLLAGACTGLVVGVAAGDAEAPAPSMWEVASGRRPRPGRHWRAAPPDGGRLA